MRPKRKGIYLMAAGILLILAAIVILLNNIREEKQAAVSALQAVEQLWEEIPVSDAGQELPSNAQEASGTAPADMNEVEIPDYILNPEMEMPEVRIDGWDYIGILEIPGLDLSLPVISQWRYPALKMAPCRYLGSAYTNDLIIAAHNYSSHFGRLKTLAAGSLINFTDVDGNFFTYRVVLVETLLPTDVEEMESGGWDLSLFTCTPGGQYRVTVRCERAE